MIIMHYAVKNGYHVIWLHKTCLRVWLYGIYCFTLDAVNLFLPLFYNIKQDVVAPH